MHICHIHDCSQAHPLTGQVPGDELKWVRCCSNDDLVAMASQNGMVILSSCDNVSHFMFHITLLLNIHLEDGCN